MSRRLKRCFFIGRVVKTALSGIEAFCPSNAHVAGDLSGQKGDGWCSGEKVRSWARSHNVQQGGTAFLETNTL